MDISGCIDEAVRGLNATDADTLVAWSEGELWRHADDAARAVSTMGALVERDTSISTAPASAAYAVPVRHTETVRVAVGGLALLPATIADLEALDNAWEDASGAPQRWTHAIGLDVLRLYPVPVAAEQVGIVMRSNPPEVSAGQPLLPYPEPLRDFITLYLLREARMRHGRGQMPDVAAAIDPVLGMYARAIAALWV